MIIQPRSLLLDIWRATLKCSLVDGEWTNTGRDGGGSISDAEQLVCLLYPAYKIPGLGIHRPDSTVPDVRDALEAFGDPVAVAKAVTTLIAGYLRRYTAPDGTPVFPAGGSLRPADAGERVTERQSALETVEAFSIAVTLSLSGLAFVKGFARHVRGPALTATLYELEEALSGRLTYAMRGLLDSFAVDVFPEDSPQGDTVYHTINQRRQQRTVLFDRLRRDLQPTRAGLREFRRLPRHVDSSLADESRLFQCGWSWGPVRTGDADRDRTAAATADPVPSPYFTAVAMDGIVDLLADQTLSLGLISAEQQSDAAALGTCWRLTQNYWTALARYGTGQWPLKDMPWRTGVGEESDYSTLQVASVVVHSLMRYRGMGDIVLGDDLTPLVDVLEELAERGGITRRLVAGSRARELHEPGAAVPLPGSERYGPAAVWPAADYAPMLLKRMLQVAGLAQDLRQRDRLLTAADSLVEHLWQRRLNRGPASGLWDAPGLVYAPHTTKSPREPSWYMTERVMEVLVVAATTVNAAPARSDSLYEEAIEMLREAEHLLAQELMLRPAPEPEPRQQLGRIEQDLRRAREVVDTRPGVALARAAEALRLLDELAVARSDATGRG
ncbi:SCO2524 family protein [Actinacidiphila alni]|uniref:SCO2524 family protein n=1 Tax=Actinacidiphila alni TaxID=380248 RepID=UPI00340C5A4C